VRAGEVKHRDSLGHHGTIGAGDIQWMTSGSGILHEEMPQVRAEGIGGLQLWLNLPAREKMSRPKYRDLASDRLTETELDGGARVRLIAGELDEGRIVGPVEGLAVAPKFLDVSLPVGARFRDIVEPGHTAFAYVDQGAVRFGETLAHAPSLIVFGDGDLIEAAAGPAGGRFLLAAARPLREPVARHGPFLMNTRAEIEEALRDLRSGRFIRAGPRDGSVARARGKLPPNGAVLADGANARVRPGVWVHAPVRVCPRRADRAADSRSADPAGRGRAGRCRAHEHGGRARRRAARLAAGRHRLVRARPPARTSSARLPLPYLARARLLREADGEPLHASGAAPAAVREVPARTQHDRAAPRRHHRHRARPVHPARQRRRPDLGGDLARARVPVQGRARGRGGGGRAPRELAARDRRRRSGGLHRGEIRSATPPPFRTPPW